MTALILRKAERKQAKLRIGVNGPSGSGKTYSALLMAYGMTGDWSKIALIDTETGSGELYSHLGEYNTVRLDAPYSPERYIEAIRLCEEANMEVIVIDSTSHEWDGKGGCLEINEKMAQTKFRGNTWSAWSETTPRHQKFIEAILTSPAHIITATRNKVETVMTEDKKVKKVGTKEIQREGFEYELTVNFNLEREHHYATASKDRTGIFSDADAFIVTPETGKKLIAWANSGKEPEQPKERKRTLVEIAEVMKAIEPGIARTKIRDRIIELTGLDAKVDDTNEVYEKLSMVYATLAAANARAADITSKLSAAQAK